MGGEGRKLVERVVCLDVEPGPASGVSGTIGVAEVGGDLIGAPYMLPVELDRVRSSWGHLAAFIGDSPVIFFNRSYDRAALARVLTRASLPVPPIATYCALVLARRHLPAVDTLPGLVLRHGLLTDAEIATRRHRFFDLGYGHKWVLNDAADDALACARLVRFLQELTHLSLDGLLNTQTPVALNEPLRGQRRHTPRR